MNNRVELFIVSLRTDLCNLQSVLSIKLTQILEKKNYQERLLFCCAISEQVYDTC